MCHSQLVLFSSLTSFSFAHYLSFGIEEDLGIFSALKRSAGAEETEADSRRRVTCLLENLFAGDTALSGCNSK